MGGPPQGWDLELAGKGVLAARGPAEMVVVFSRLEVVYIC